MTDRPPQGYFHRSAMTDPSTTGAPRLAPLLDDDIICAATAAAAPDHYVNAETFGHVCNEPRGHVAPHECRCGERWSGSGPHVPDSTTGAPRTELPNHMPVICCRAHALAGEREAADIDVQAARLVFHEEYERDESGDRYYGCQHRNQHRSTWDCQQRVEEFAAHYARLRASDTATGRQT